MYWLLLALACDASLNDPPDAKRRKLDVDRTEVCDKALAASNEYFYSGFYLPRSDGLIHRIINLLDIPENEGTITLADDPHWTPHVAELTLARDKHYVLFDKCVSLYRLDAPDAAIDTALASIYAERSAVTAAYERFLTTPLTSENLLQLHRLIVGDHSYQGAMISELHALLALKNYFE